MATVRPNGFVAVRPVTNYTSGAGSISVKVTGPQMLMTADTAPSGSISLWCVAWRAYTHSRAREISA